MADEKKNIERQIELQKKKIEDRRTHEAEDHAKWYQERVVTRKTDEAKTQELTEQLRAAMHAYAPGGTSPDVMPSMSMQEQKKETERFGQMVPAVTAGAQPIMPSAPPRSSENDTAPVSVLSAPPIAIAQTIPAAGRVARPEVKVSLETVKVQSAQQDMKPRIEDVAFTGGPQLVGLTQELHHLTIADFRRLGRTPELAAQQIIQKIDILGQESFEKRLEGIHAFQTSPLQETYVRLVSEAFAQGRPVIEIAEEKRAAGVDSLRADEVGAIISVNSTLHY